MKTIILRYGELYLKGDNQKYFKKALANNIKKAFYLKGLNFVLQQMQGRFVLKVEEKDLTQSLEILKYVFGLASYSTAEEMPSNAEEIINYVKSIKIDAKTFRVSVNRADKNFKYTSIEFERLLGGVVLESNSHLKVDLTNPEAYVKVDIREENKTFVYSKVYKGAGGLPLGTAGRGLLLLSGGIDSPVAGYQVAKRGLEFEALHFHSYPYTSELAKEKVIALAKKVREFNPNLKLHFVSITKFQEEVNKHCKSEYMIALMRRFMFMIAEHIAKEKKMGAVITGESLGQVASQTMESLTSTNNVLKSVIAFRPLLSFDKAEIIEISEKINTYETSILPYEDCCTVFLPKRPIIKPKLRNVVFEESKINLEELLKISLDSLETIELD
jgi:thiamine biosynthesis protein ThiI